MTHPTPLVLPTARVEDTELVFSSPAGEDHALALGAFALKIPDDIDPRPGLHLCRNFYRPAADVTNRYRGHREATHPRSSLGYEDRPDQVEQLQIESHLWKEYFPDEVAEQLRRMRLLTLYTLEGLLRLAGVPDRDHETVTGGARAETNLCYSTINHYRSELDRSIGIVEHTDSGFITTIYADQPGFEAFDGDTWRPVREQPGHFIVNTGDAFDVLTRHLRRPVRGVLHRVAATHPDRSSDDRSSYTVYMGPRFNMPLYQYGHDGVRHEYQGFRAYSVEKAARMGYEFHSRV